MLTTLHSKLSGALLIIFIAFAALTLALNLVATRAFLDEVNQKVAVTLASRMAADRPLIVGNRVDQTAVKALFSAAMIINPLAEIYLLDPSGHIVTSSVPAAAIRRADVRLGPIRALLQGEPPPVRGDDPRDSQRQKVFSAAALPVGPTAAREAPAATQGYLYIVLGGEQFDSVVRMLISSQILRWGAWSMAGSLLGAIVAGSVIVRLLTRPLRQLIRGMERLEAGGYRRGDTTAMRPRRWPDETDHLTTRFDALSEQLAVYVERLNLVDAQRREFVANVSHDLKTPLSAVQGYLDTLLIKGATLTETERRAFVELALGQSKRVDRLASELLELSRLDSGDVALQTEWIPVGDLVQDVVQKFQHAAADHQIALSARFDPDLPLVRLDIRLIERLLDNLVDNALQHTGPGGAIVVACLPSPDGVVVQVEDSGDGIHPDDLPHIFDRFYRGRRPSGALGGAGLGLAISRRIADAHQATLVVESREASGTIFTLTLPVHPRSSGE